MDDHEKKEDSLFSRDTVTTLSTDATWSFGKVPRLLASGAELVLIVDGAVTSWGRTTTSRTSRTTASRTQAPPTAPPIMAALELVPVLAGTDTADVE